LQVYCQLDFKKALRLIINTNLLYNYQDCTDDFDQNFIIRCDQADVYRDINGLCYNYSSPSGKTPIGWWDIQKRLEFRKPVMPSQDYFK
jgi:hypothetical protein